MKKIIYKGFISERERGEHYDAVYIGDTDEPIAFELESINRKQVSVRYFISDTEKSKNELTENFICSLAGATNADYSDRYSDLTGYLWTDEELNIGGHDLMKEIKENIGKYIYMEIDVHE